MWRRQACAIVGLSFLLSSCGFVGQFVEYTDGLRNSEERTVVVRGVAQVGGFAGLLAGVPVSIVAVPVTYPSYLVHASFDEEEASLLSMLALPSLALRGVGSLLGAPVDIAEFLLYRVWLPPTGLSGPEQEDFELQIDQDTLPRYPVTPIFPRKSAE